MSSEKKCSRCGEVKSQTEFGRNAAKRSGLQNECRDCRRVVNKIQYERGKAYQNPKRAAASAALRRRNREFIRAYLGEHSCVDCGEDDIVVLQFDHQRDKVAHVSTLMRCSSLAAVKAEVAKCEVACANCHTRRTAATYSWWRVSPDDAA